MEVRRSDFSDLPPSFLVRSNQLGKFHTWESLRWSSGTLLQRSQTDLPLLEGGSETLFPRSLKRSVLALRAEEALKQVGKVGNEQLLQVPKVTG